MDISPRRQLPRALLVAAAFVVPGTLALGQTAQSQLVLVDVNSGDVTRMPSSAFVDEEPDWSPDGLQILFDSQRNGSRDVYLMDADGSSVRRLTTSRAKEDHASWSPDGTAIVYQRQQGGNTDVWVMNANGTTQRRLTRHPARDGWPDWSPDGTHIVFSSERDGRREVYLMNADGTEQTRLTTSLHGSTDPACSPDGEWIAFNSDHDGDSDVFLMRLDGTGVRKLTDDEDFNERPVWSPNGSTIFYAKTNLRTREFSIHRVDIDGGNDRRVSPIDRRLTRPNCSPDGETLLAQELSFKDLQPESEVVFQAFDPASFDVLAGSYELDASPGSFFVFTRERGRYFGAPPGMARVEILPSSSTSFFPKNYPGSIEFHVDEKGVGGVTVNVGRKMTATRTD